MTNTSRRGNGINTDQFDSSLFDLVAVYLSEEDRVVVVSATEATPNILTIKQMEGNP